MLDRKTRRTNEKKNKKAKTMPMSQLYNFHKLGWNALGVALLGTVVLSGAGWTARAQQKPQPLAAPSSASPSRPAPGPQPKVLPAPPAHAAPVGAQSVELRMKFKQGDINRYQMTMRANLILPGQPASATTLYDTNLSMVLQQRVAKANPDGSAQIEITTLSGAGTVSGQPFKPDVSGKPSQITFDARNNIVAAKDLPQSLNNGDVTGKLFQSGALSTQGVYLPKKPVRIGDRWTQKVGIASLGKDSGGTVQTTFVRMEPVGLFQTARLRSLMKIPFTVTDNTAKTPVPLKGMLNMTYDSNLAVAEGKVVRSTGIGGITVVVVAPTKPASASVVRSSDKAKAGQRPEQTAAPQRVTVNLQLGNNLIMQ